MTNKKNTVESTQFRSVFAVRKSLVTCAFLATTLVACSDGGDDSIVAEVETSGFIMPQGLQRASFPSNDISAFISIDGGAREAMSIDSENGVAKFSKKVSNGNHEFLLEMLYESSSSIPLVTAAKTVDVGGADGKSISFAEKDYQYADTDGDEYTNVREIEAGSDPFASGSIPADGDDNYEENDQFDFAYDITGMEGVNFDKSLSTGQGYVTVDDSYDVYKITLASSRATLNAEFVTTNGIFGGLLYLDSSNNAVPAAAQEVDSGSSSLRKWIWTFSNPQPRAYYLLIGPGPEDTETPMAGGYFMKWYSTQ